VQWLRRFRAPLVLFSRVRGPSRGASVMRRRVWASGVRLLQLVLWLALLGITILILRRRIQMALLSMRWNSLAQPDRIALVVPLLRLLARVPALMVNSALKVPKTKPPTPPTAAQAATSAPQAPPCARTVPRVAVFPHQVPLAAPATRVSSVMDWVDWRRSVRRGGWLVVVRNRVKVTQPATTPALSPPTPPALKPPILSGP